MMNRWYKMQLKPWLRLVRLRFLLASVIAVSAGIAVSWNEGAVLNLYNAALTMLGVVLLHASVDVLNDYWDFKRGIDTRTKRTPFSGGTGVLPEKILQAKDVRTVGLGLLVAGASVGAYFVATSGLTIAVLLGFAIVSIYFYSTRIVDSGLAEVFVAVKGTMIVLGSAFIQQGVITASAAHAELCLGYSQHWFFLLHRFQIFTATKTSASPESTMRVESKSKSKQLQIQAVLRL